MGLGREWDMWITGSSAGCWSSLPSGSFPAGRLGHLSYVRKWPGVLPRDQEPRDWLSSLGGWSLTSCSALFTCSLYPRNSLRSRGMSGFGCRVELEDYRVQCRGAVAACLQKTYLPRVWVFAPMLRA